MVILLSFSRQEDAEVSDSNRKEYNSTKDNESVTSG